MGKSETQLPIQQQHRNQHHGSSFFVRCSMGFKRIFRLFSFKCVFILLLSVGVFLSAFFSVLHLHHRKSGFDAKAIIKQSATVQACFKLQKPVSFLLPQIARLEYDINDEIGIPYTQVAILSMHQARASNCTDVVFGILSDPMSSPINAVSLSVLRSSLVEVFTQLSNLALTTSIFGQPSSFEILKFPGGITIIPKQSPPIWLLPPVLFNFTLPNSIQEIDENFVELEQQLTSGLHLQPTERVYVRVTNKAGSTRDRPVIIQASIVSDLGGLLVPQRLKQLAETINGSSTSRNLGLDHSVFGKVKEVSLSSYLYHTLDAPTPSPAPSPEPYDLAEPPISPSPAISPSPPSSRLPPCTNCEVSSQSPSSTPDQSSLPFSNSPEPSMDPSCDRSTITPAPSPVSNHHAFSPRSSTRLRSQMPPDFPPLPAVSYGSRPTPEKGYQKGPVPPPPSALLSPSSSAYCSRNRLTWPFLFFTFLTHCIL